MQVMPWGCELRDAGVLHSKHSGSLALGSRSSFHGLAKEIAARDLLAIEGWHAKRWAEPLANPRAHGKGLSRRVGLAPGRGAFARPRHAGPVRSSHPGMDSHRCALPRVLTDSVDNRLPSRLLFAVLVVALPAAAHGEGSPETVPFAIAGTEGFGIVSADGASRLITHWLLQSDLRAFLSSHSPTPDRETFLLRFGGMRLSKQPTVNVITFHVRWTDLKLRCDCVDLISSNHRGRL